MREILFRAIAINSQEWVYGSILDYKYSRDRITCIVSNTGKSIEVLRKSVGQFTNQKDKNDFEIYEGDLVLDDEGEYIKEIRFGGPWHHAAFGILGKRNLPRFNKDIPYTWDLLNYEQARHLNIVGNIHNNPELIDSKGKAIK